MAQNDRHEPPTQLDLWNEEHDAMIERMKRDARRLKAKLKRILAGDRVYSV